jgi:hypothetical protein
MLCTRSRVVKACRHDIAHILSLLTCVVAACVRCTLPTTAIQQIIALVMKRGVLGHVPQQYCHFVVACCLPVIPESGAKPAHLGTQQRQA